MKRRILLGLVIFLSLSLVSYAQQSDALLETLQNQVQKNKAQFDKIQSGVYLLSYRVDDEITHYVNSSMGSLINAVNAHTRTLTVQVRVGSYELDNFHELRDDYSDMLSFSSTIELPLSDDSKALEQLIWLETDKAYRNACQRFEKVKANVAVKAEADDHAPDYSQAAKEIYFEEPIEDTLFHENEWIHKLKDISSIFKNNKDVQTGNASIRYNIVRKYFVNSEHTSIVQNKTYCHLYISAEGQADDGMELPMYTSYFAHTPDFLPSLDSMQNVTRNLSDKISRLVKAPVVDSYTGPALLSKDAAGVFFHEIFGHRVEGQRLKESTDGQTFKKKLGEQVLPTDISVIFDPSIDFYNGIPLNGSYKYDDEGYFGYRVPVVEKGILKRFLMTRTPIDSFPISNGHARAQAGRQPVSRQSNLIVETDHPCSDSELRQMLVAEAKAQGKPYAYYFVTVNGGFTTTGRYMPNAFNVTPLEVYRIYVDGRPDELVRGVDLVGTPLSMFSHIVAAGDEHGNFAGTCGAESGSIPAGCCSPALFVSQIEMQKKSKSQQRPPILPRTVGNNTSDSFETLCFDAMEDELERNMASLQLENLASPYFISYLISDAKVTAVESSLGGITYSSQVPYRDKDVTVLVGNNKRNNQNYCDLNTLFNYSGSSTRMAIDNDYSNIRQNLWRDCDEEYKTNAEFLEAKNAAINQQNLPEKVVNMPDRNPSPTHNNFAENTNTSIDLKSMEEMMNVLSQTFAEFPELTHSGVNFYAYQADAYYLDSEGLKYKQPFNMLCVNIFAETMTDDGENLADAENIFRNDLSELPTTAQLQSHIREFASRLTELRHAPAIDVVYDGPVLFADEAAAALVKRTFFQQDNGLMASRKPIFGSAEVAQYYGRYADKDNSSAALMNKKLISRDLTIKAYNNSKLISGHVMDWAKFPYDAEGYESEDEQLLVENGVLMQLLSDRRPCENAAYSNGHRRLALDELKLTTRLAPGIIRMESKNKTSYKQLKKKLISMAKAEDYDYCYIITKLPDDDISYNSGMDKYTSDEKVLRPIYCYRIEVKTGKEELVRQVKLSPLSAKTFKHVVSVSSEYQDYMTTFSKSPEKTYPAWHFNLFGVPCSFIVPQSILFEELELSKDENVNLQKAPFIDNPLKK